MRRRARRLILWAAVSTPLAAATVFWLLSANRPDFGVLAGAERRVEGVPRPGVTLERVRLKSRAGDSMECLLRRPSGPTAPGSTSAILLLGGIGTGQRAALLVDPSFPALTLACDYPWADPSRLPLLSLLLRLPRLRGEVLATPDAMNLAASFLVGLPEVDPHRLAAVGASLGVPFVTAWAARDARVSAVALVYGGGDLRVLFEATLRRRIGIGWVRRLVALVASVLVADLDPARTVGGVAPRPLLLIGSRDDERVPPASVEALERSAREPKTVVWFNGQHITPNDTTLVRAISDSVVAWLGRSMASRPPPTVPPHTR